jgi:hypothetical protein
MVLGAWTGPCGQDVDESACRVDSTFCRVLPALAVRNNTDDNPVRNVSCGASVMGMSCMKCCILGNSTGMFSPRVECDREKGLPRLDNASSGVPRVG